jgi:trigger factor
VIDFDGRVDGQPFEGGTGKDFTLALGSRSMVPGFEDQLVGAMPGETREIAVTFPDDFGHAALAGKAANFTVTVKEVREAQPYALDEEWAKGLGEESVEAVRAKLRERLEQEYAGVSRSRLKRQLLDVLAERYVFPVPEGMVDLEFESIWRQLKDEMERTGQSFPEVAGKDEDALKAEYRQIAERRVRLGLLLADIGSRNEVRVESEELQQAAFREAMRFPGQERKVLDLFRSNPNALEQLRAPIFEDKVCDLIIAKARVEEERVPIAELLRDPDEEEAAPTGSEETPALAAASDEPASAEPAGADVSSR